jgi:hypothetical protein
MKSSSCCGAEGLIVVIRGLTSYCCGTEENVVAMRGLASYCCAAGGCCCYASSDKLRPGRIGQLGQTGKNQTQCFYVVASPRKDFKCFCLSGKGKSKTLFLFSEEK